MSMLQVTRSNLGFYLCILIHIYLSIITNQTNIYLLLMFTKYSFIAKRYSFIKQSCQIVKFFNITFEVKS